MKEIEIKARIKNPEEVIKKLESLGCSFSDSIRQTDTVYTKIVGNVEQYLTNDHYLRIREKSDGRFIFTFKRPLSKVVLTKTEHETEIKDAKEFEQALLQMGYQAANKVIKERRTAHIKDIEICIDEVVGLGSFIEVEKKTDQGEVAVRKDLNSFLDTLGVSVDDQVHKGYDIMAIEQGI